MEIIKELKDNQTLLLLMPSAKYNSISTDIIKKLAQGSVCYVTLNKTQDALEEAFKKKKIKIDNIIYVDAITRTIKNVPSQSNRVYFVSSPGALTELSLAITKFLNHNFKYLIFDSLTNMLVYEKKAPVAKFVHSLTTKIKGSQTKAIFYALNIEEQKSLIQECGMFVDRVVTVK